MASDRPRRSTRKPDWTQHADPSTPSPSSSKRTKQKKSAGDDLDYLLTNPKSKLTTMDLSTMFNIDTWSSLSLDSRNKLIKLLPPTAFKTFKPKIEPTHPSVSQAVGAMEVDSNNPAPEPALEALDPSFFTDSHFLAALRTFQDQLYTGWMTPSHQNQVETYLQRIRDGTLHAPWKDQIWERDHADEVEENVASTSRSYSLAGEAKDIKLTDLVKSGSLQVGDILVYKRVFSLLPLTVEKDVMITSFNSYTNSLEVLVSPGARQYLPQTLVVSPDPANDTFPDNEGLLSMSIITPSSLETGILDVDGRVDKAHRPNGNAWKAISVWKRRDGEEFGVVLERGGRENSGTLFYLRNCLYYDH